jgi:hypothetical protein
VIPAAVSAALAVLAFLFYTFALVMAINWSAAQLMDLQFAWVRPSLFGRTGLWLTSAFFVKGMVGQPLVFAFFHPQLLTPDLVLRVPRVLLDAVLLAFAIHRGVITILYAKVVPGTKTLTSTLSWLTLAAAAAWCDTKLVDESLIVAIALIVTTVRVLTMRVYFRWLDSTKLMPGNTPPLLTQSPEPAESRIGEQLGERPTARALARTLFLGGLLLAGAAFATDQVTDMLSGTVPIIIAMILSMFFDRTAERVKAVRAEFPVEITGADRPLLPVTPAPPRIQGGYELGVVRRQVEQYLMTGRPSYVISLKSGYNAMRLLAFTVHPGTDGAQDQIFQDALHILTMHYWYRAHALRLLSRPAPTRPRDSGDLRMLAVLSSVLIHESGRCPIPRTSDLEREVGKRLPLDAVKARSMLIAMSQEARSSLGWSWRSR